MIKEADAMTINLAKILAELSGLIKKRNGKLSITQKGEKLLLDNVKLLELIIKTMTTKFNWAYYDGYGNNNIGQMGFGFSLILLQLYGKTKQKNTFYADKYFKAYPYLINTLPRFDYDTPINIARSCYSLRTFDRFLVYFGLVKIETIGKEWNSAKFVTETELFDTLIKVRLHKYRYN